MYKFILTQIYIAVFVGISKKGGSHESTKITHDGDRNGIAVRNGGFGRRNHDRDGKQR
jgi:hypothetical protein